MRPRRCRITRQSAGAALRPLNALWGIGVLLPLAISAAWSSQQDTAAISGCYRFDRAYFQWTARAPAPRFVTRESTAVLRLSNRADINHQFWATGSGRALDVYPVPPSPDTLLLQWLGPSHWSVEDLWSINVVWSNGHSRSAFRLSVMRDSLRGQVRFTTDVQRARERPPEVAWAVRVACPTG